jgi:hypothetical protein
MLKRYLLASLVAGLALGAQSAVAGGTLWFYEGHGWLPQPPFSSSSHARDSRPVTVIPASAPRQVGNPQPSASPRAPFPAPYDTPGGYFN